MDLRACKNAGGKHHVFFTGSKSDLQKAEELLKNDFDQNLIAALQVISPLHESIKNLF
jgi:hypothetical protein